MTVWKHVLVSIGEHHGLGSGPGQVSGDLGRPQIGRYSAQAQGDRTRTTLAGSYVIYAILPSKLMHPPAYQPNTTAYNAGA
jgi:hypothetical protein